MYNPATNEVVTKVPETLEDEFQHAVHVAKTTYQQIWKKTTILTRQRLMFKFQEIIKRDEKRLIDSIVLEQGKTLADAAGDVLRGLQVVEHSCSAPSLLMGETIANISQDMDTISYREPLGVVSGIAPFNFPAMIPLWILPMALVAGNTCVLKPSEKDPGAAMILMEMLQEAGSINPKLFFF